MVSNILYYPWPKASNLYLKNAEHLAVDSSLLRLGNWYKITKKKKLLNSCFRFDIRRHRQSYE